MPSEAQSAAIIAIGDELLRGDTQDTNTHFLARQLTARGVSVERCLLIPDNENEITRLVRELHSQIDVLCVCGGIGPTPDDLTRQSVAVALGVPLGLHKEAAAEYSRRRGMDLNAGQLEMCRLPVGCSLLWSEFPSPPGFRLGNVYVLPGVPQILESMWVSMARDFTGTPLYSSRFQTRVGESRWAHIMREFAEQHPLLKFGSYPKMGSEWRVEVLVQGRDVSEVEITAGALEREISRLEK